MLGNAGDAPRDVLKDVHGEGGCAEGCWEMHGGVQGDVLEDVKGARGCEGGM